MSAHCPYPCRPKSSANVGLKATFQELLHVSKEWMYIARFVVL